MAEPEPDTTGDRARRVGLVSLGCAKALVDSERILTQLRAEGYELVGCYDEADLVIVNTCGFIDEARAESLEAIGEALEENGRVVVTGCLGAEAGRIREAHPRVLAVTGPHDYEAVMHAVHRHLPPPRESFLRLLPGEGVRLTPAHYAYLKIAEGCDRRCSFCIIPRLRGPQRSRPVGEVLAEAERLVAGGVRELLVVAQDTAAYGSDLRYSTGFWGGRPVKARITDLVRALGGLGVWVRLHYVYPYPHVDELVALMAEGLLLPYLDVPFQHASPPILRAMRRPAAVEGTLERVRRWREVCPELALRSTFIVGFPGETEADFERLLDFVEAAGIDRAGCFVYSPVEGAAANALSDPVAEDVALDRQARFMEVAARVSAQRLARRVGVEVEVLVDAVEGGEAVGRTPWDAPEVDGQVRFPARPDVTPGDRVRVRIETADVYDLRGRMVP